MHYGFVKLYSTFLDSSLWWGEDEATRLVWITLLAAADYEGVYSGTIPGLAGKARVTLEACRHAVERLSSPDADSRSTEYEGRRIEVFPGGVRLLNYAKYRDMRSPKQVQNAIYKARQRERDKSECQPDITPDLRSEILDERSGSGSEGSPEGGTAPSAPVPRRSAPRASKRGPISHFVPEDWKPTEKHVAKAQSLGFDAERYRLTLQDFRTWEFSKGRSDFNKAFTSCLLRESTRGAFKARSGALAPRGGAFRQGAPVSPGRSPEEVLRDMGSRL